MENLLAGTVGRLVTPSVVKISLVDHGGVATDVTSRSAVDDGGGGRWRLNVGLLGVPTDVAVCSERGWL